MNTNMKTRATGKQSGMTMIELMIVVIIIAILVTLAYPSYIDYVRKAKRGEAHQLLLNWSINQEIFRSNNAEYATVTQLPVPVHDNYTFGLEDLIFPETPSTAYRLIATATGDQENDKNKAGDPCSPLRITQSGMKTAGPEENLSANCWN